MSYNPFTKDGYTGRVPHSTCPVCFHKLDAVTNVTGPDKPEAGDFTVCVGCANVLRFDSEMRLVLSSLEAIPAHSRFNFAKVVMLMKQFPISRFKKGGE